MATKSIGLTGRDYSTLAAWASYVSALSLSAAEIGEVYNDSGAVADTTEITVGGWTGANGTNTVTLRPASGQGFKDNANVRTNALRWNASNGAALTNSVGTSTGAYIFSGAYLRVTGLQFYASDDLGIAVRIGSTTAQITDCIFENRSNVRGPAVVVGAATVENCVFIRNNASGSTSHGISVEYVTGTATFIGCTIVDLGGSTGNGISSYGGTTDVLAKNCAVYGFDNDYKTYGSCTFNAASTNNATTKASFDTANAGQNGQVSLVGSTEWESLTVGSYDLRLKSGSAKLLNNGATTGTGYDITGTARSGSYDIGAWERSSTSTVPINILTGSNSQRRIF